MKLLRGLLFLILGVYSGAARGEAFHSLYQPSLTSVKLVKLSTKKKSYSLEIRIKLENISGVLVTGRETFRAYVTDLGTADQIQLGGSIDLGLGPGDSVECTLSNWLRAYATKPRKIRILILRVVQPYDPGAYYQKPEQVEQVWSSFTMTRKDNEYALDDAEEQDQNSGNQPDPLKTSP